MILTALTDRSYSSAQASYPLAALISGSPVWLPYTLGMPYSSVWWPSDQLNHQPKPRFTGWRSLRGGHGTPCAPEKLTTNPKIIMSTAQCSEKEIEKGTYSPRLSRSRLLCFVTSRSKLSKCSTLKCSLNWWLSQAQQENSGVQGPWNRSLKTWLTLFGAE